MKSKILLIAISAALVITLAVGGTLMLFTSKSEVATNVVTLGNMKVRFFEGANPVPPDTTAVPNAVPSPLLELGLDPQPSPFNTPAGSTYDFTSGEDNNKFSGITFTTKLVPNAVISKVPVIKYEGVPGYLRVKADITVMNGTSPVAVASGSALETILKDIFIDIGKTLNPAFDPAKNGDTGLSYYFYYAPLVDSARSLTAITEESMDSDGQLVLFKGFQIKNYDHTNTTILDAFETLKGYTVTLQLQVQAIQADWNFQEGKSLATKRDWGAFFTQIDTEIAANTDSGE
jgi:predicted ribosomally synthesized peptide with SipW-like signal peptide